MTSIHDRPVVTELRLSAFKSHRGATFGFGPITLLCGGSGTGKSSVLEALAALGRLACGDGLDEVFGSVVRGGAAACVPQDAQPDAQGRRGFRIGCTVTGPVGPVRLDVAVQAEPTLRIVGERLTGAGETLLTTALRDPERPTVQAAWHTAGLVSVTRAPLPDDRLATALLPLRVAGRTDGQRLVLAAAEQMVVALRGVFPIAPRPELMRGPVPVSDGRLRASCDNLSAVLARTEGECGTRHAMLVNAVRAVCSPPVEGITALRTAALPTGTGGGVREGEAATKGASRSVGAAGAAGAKGPGSVRGAVEVGRAAGSVGAAGAAGAAGGAGFACGAGAANTAGALDSVIAAVDRGPLGLVPVDRLGDGELRFLALALVLLTGPGVLDVDTSTELLPASQVLTVLGDGLDHGLDRRQLGELLRLAGPAAERGHIRLLGTVQDAGFAEGLGGVSVTALGVPRPRRREDAVEQSG
jgi:energy-coupling factor transporter ATP-binding protein EcfA2